MLALHRSLALASIDGDRPSVWIAAVPVARPSDAMGLASRTIRRAAMTPDWPRAGRSPQALRELEDSGLAD